MGIAELVPHKNPIPHCTKIGDTPFSGSVIGYAPDGAPPDGFDAQTEYAFASMKATVEGAGFSLGDAAEVTVFLKDQGNREPVKREWLALFPEENDRPARRAVKAELDADMHIQLEFVAVQCRRHPQKQRKRIWPTPP